jgi:acetyl-CoA carboxylase carboxyltransferase component
MTKLLLSYLPQNNTEDPPQLEPYDPADRMDESLNTIVPEDDRPGLRHARGAGHDLRPRLDSEVHEEWAPNAMVAFARLDGNASASSRTSRW